MDPSLMDELFERIANLEKDNQELDDKLNTLNAEIENKKKSSLLRLWLSDELNKKNKKDKELTQKQLEDMFAKAKEQIKSTSVKYTFSFKPIETSYQILFITGSFNNWQIAEMSKGDNNTFTYTTYLKKGYEYIFNYSTGDDVMIDFNIKQKKIKERNNLELNVIQIPNDDGSMNNDGLNPLESNREIFDIKGDANEIFKNLFQIYKIINERKVQLAEQRKKASDEVMQVFNLKNKEFNEVYSKMIDTFNTTYKGRILLYENAYYLIQEVLMKDTNIRCLRLYDPNGIHSDIKLQGTIRRYQLISLNTLFESSIILSDEESKLIMNEYNNDTTHFIKILYQLQDVPGSKDKEILPYKVIPETVDINQYEFIIQDNVIREVRHRSSDCFVTFEPVLIGEIKNDLGLVASSLIKVYTTLYNKDILNIMHIHINDTSQEITIDSEFLEKDEPILNHKVFPTDSMGKKLKYKFIIKDYKLVKIYYAMSNDYIDEPEFQEVRFIPNGFVKIAKGEYKNYTARIRQFPLGMLARKDKDDTVIKKMNSFGIQKEGVCGDRHFAELPGFVVLEVLFEPGRDGAVLDKPIGVNIPLCHLIPLSPKENIEFEKRLVKSTVIKENENIDKVLTVYEKFKEYEKYLNNQNEMDNFDMEQLKEILSNLEKEYKFEPTDDEDLNSKISFISSIKTKLTPVIYSKIRLLVLSGKK